MTPIERLRAADPAAGTRLDGRAERELVVLLGEPPAARPVAPRTDPVPRRRPFVPVLVTAVVAILVVAGSAAVIGGVHPRVEGGAAPATSAPATMEPPYDVASCDPVKALPFQCGTYTSTYGGTSITGDTGGPVQDPLSLSVTTQQGGLVLVAVTRSCFAATVPVRLSGSATAGYELVHAGKVVVADFAGCKGTPGDTKNWAYAFLTGKLDVDQDMSFGRGRSAVFFQYAGAAAIGQRQLARNDAGCVAAHVQPFGCGTYRSTGGTGTLAFLGSSPFRLTFSHVNGQLTAALYGACNGISSAFEVDGRTVVALGGGVTTMGCSGSRGTDDDAVVRFFHGVLTFDQYGTTVTFTSSDGSTTATFRR